MKYCGKRTFEESIATNQKANIIVPFGGVKTFSDRNTIEEPLMCPENVNKCTHLYKRRNNEFSLSIIILQMILST